MSPKFAQDSETFLRTLIESTTVAETIEQITAFAAECLDTAFVGATLIHRGGKRIQTAGPTHPVVREADELQDRLREGPCIDAAVESRTLVSNDLASDPRWPNWAPRIADLGLRSVLSSEIHSVDRRIGALNVYGSERRTFTREDMEVAQLLAGHAGVALRVSQMVEGLTTALDSRTVIAQAQGILMNQFTLDADRAFSVLKRLSQDRNIRLLRVAERIVAGDLQFAPPTTTPVSGPCRTCGGPAMIIQGRGREARRRTARRTSRELQHRLPHERTGRPEEIRRPGLAVRKGASHGERVPAVLELSEVDQ